LAGIVLSPSVHADGEYRHDVHTSHFIDCTLELNPYAGGDRAAPPQKLALAFSTAAVLILC
jgi:hypothetical protein